MVEQRMQKVNLEKDPRSAGHLFSQRSEPYTRAGDAYVAYWYDIRTKIKLLVGSNLFGGKEESELVGISVQARDKQPENINTLSTSSQRQKLIPLICHGSHGYIRVNFFWPV